MKSFWKTAIACAVGLILTMIVLSVMWTASISAFMATLFSEEQVEVPENSVLDINFAHLNIAEQTIEDDILSSLESGATFTGGTDMQDIRTVGILDAVKALEQAANDPRIKVCYLRPDEASDISHMEEFRRALMQFRQSGKPVYAFIEHPTNLGFWIASTADRIFMEEYNGGMNMLVGLSGQMTYFKDLLDKLGINIQLIRHGKYKSAGEPFIRSTPSEENLEQQRVMIEGLWKEIATQTAERRSMSFEEFNALIDNLELCTPADFLDKGLVDETTGLSGMKQRLCSVTGEDEYEDIHSICLADYVSATSKPDYSTDDRIAIIYADGEIVDGNGAEEVAGKAFVKMIEEVRQDDDIKGVVLRVNSPGGSVVAASQIKEAIDALKAAKPVVASYGSYAASGGYWISAGCERIFSDATTLTGSIGVFGIIPDLSKTAKNVAHLNIVPVSSNAHSDMFSLMRPLTKEEIEFEQKSIEMIYSEFTGLVSEGRHMDVEKVDELGQGRVWTGTDALERGLVDEIGGLKEALDYTAQLVGCPTYRLESYPRPLTAAEQIVNMMTPQQDDDLVKIYKKVQECRKVEVLARMPYSMVIR